MDKIICPGSGLKTKNYIGRLGAIALGLSAFLITHSIIIDFI